MSVLSEAFAGLTKSLSTEAASPRHGEPKNQHEIFLQTQLIPLTTKLQKETRGRRCKEVHVPLQDALLALKAFQNEEWPPKHSRHKENGQAKAATADTTEKISADQRNEETSSISIDGTEATATDLSEEAEQSEKNAATTAATREALAPMSADDKSTSSTDSTTAAIDDDPQTREPVHAAIATTLEAFVAVLGHPDKTSRACELALEGVTLIITNHYFSGRAGGRDDVSGSGSHVVETADKNGTRPPPASLLHRLMESVSKCSESTVETVQSALIKTLRTIMTSPKCGVHEASMLLAMRSTFHVYLVTKSQSCKDSAKSALLDIMRSVFSRMEAYDAVARSQELYKPAAVTIATTVSSDDGEQSEETVGCENGLSGEEAAHKQPASATTTRESAFASQYHTDSYVLFRSLCKLSSKELPADNQNEPDRARLFNTQIPTDPLALNSKILSLELILAALDYCGPAFCQGEKFTYLVHHYLCVSLLKNCMSNHTQVAFLSQKIFLVLVYKFKGHMKQEIEVFLSNVFLRVLESENSSFKQKALVLESLRSLCKDPVLLTQIFLNYDCDFDAMNLYKDIVHMLTKLGGKATSAPSTSVSKKDAEQEFELSLAGMEVLVTILKAFLRALGLPGGEEGDGRDDTAGARIRGMLQLDVGLAAGPEDRRDAGASADQSVASDDSLSGRLSSKAREGNESQDSSKSSDVAGKIVGAFEMKRNAEQNFEIGAVKFTLSIKGGLNFFISNGFVERDAREIALFFLANKDKLDKTQMGEVLGKEPDSAFVKGDGVDPEKGGPGFWVRILHHYVNALDFSDLLFDDAIRLFLSGFRLPGEAQKIDRIMEKFAEQFTSQNPDVFPSADTAFILAFSVIMLQTDLHSPNIKPEKRMTVESFIRNNRGIGENGGDLPDEFLTGIYDRIKERPFSLKEDDDAREKAGAPKQIFDTSVFFEGSSFFGQSAEERKREKFKKERDEMMAVTQQLFHRRPEKNSRAAAESPARLTETVSPADVVKPMFDVTWGPMIGIFSQVLECSDDERSVAVCLNAFVYAIRIASHSSMSLSRDTFVSSLAKFTFLGSIKEMKQKNVESARTLLSIAVIDGEFLGESWGPVLQCISQIARLRLTASGLDSDESFLVEKGKSVATSSRGDALKDAGLFRQPSSRSEIAREAEENNARAVLEAVQEVLIDKVFSSTVSLSANSLAHFIEQLIAVSSSEIEGTSKSGITGVESTRSALDSDGTGSKHGEGPSIFSLQRLVDVADYNMDVRPRLVWAQVWEMMADYFTKIACHENAMVSVFAIDSLKQLSLKFLEKPELSEFNFQRVFLKPFLVVMEDKGSREDVRELVLRCVDNIIRTKSHNLRSGWKIVFSILTRSASDPSEKIDYLGLAILQRLLDEHLDELCSMSDELFSEDKERELPSLERLKRNTNADDFVGLCRASLSFIQKDESDSPRPIGLSMRAFCHAAIYADLLAAKRILPPVSGAQWTNPDAQCYTYEGLSEEESLEMALWRPLLEGLAEGVRSTTKSSAAGVGCLIQRASILALRAIFLRHGQSFSTSQWVAVLEQTLLPSVRAGAENDSSPVARITSESPSVSNIDFLVDSLPLPPPSDDVSLLRFEALSTTPSRSLGPAELMLEASFTDLRHGGNGDLRRAHLLAKKAESSALKVHEQPFPDSWIATTAPIALGLLTDIVTEIIVIRGEVGRQRLWPIVACQYKMWYLGRESSTDETLASDSRSWSPCEALVRISCRELHRLPPRLAETFPSFSKADAASWVSLILNLFCDLLSKSVVIEDAARQDLLQSKQKALSDRMALSTEDGSSEDEEKEDEGREEIVHTVYGTGRLLKTRTDCYPNHAGGADLEIVVKVFALDFGGTLFCPQMTDGSRRGESPAAQNGIAATVSKNGIPAEVNVPNAYWEDSVPALKIRSIAAHCLHQSVIESLDQLIPLATRDTLSVLRNNLDRSRLSAAAAVGDEDISTAFQAALLNDWGDEIVVADEARENAARFSLSHGSSMFFLTQEAGATHAIIHLLSMLYLQKRDTDSWDRAAFAEPNLLLTMEDVLDKFLESEAKDGRQIDPNVWRNATERGGKVALYCTSFASVVIEILKIIRSVSPEQFAEHKQVFFPRVCALIRVQSEDIRQLVQEILALQVAPILGVEVDLQRQL